MKALRWTLVLMALLLSVVAGSGSARADGGSVGADGLQPDICVPADCPPGPSDPHAFLTVTATTPTTISLRWTDYGPSTGVRQLFRRTQAGIWQFVASWNGARGQTSYTDTRVTPGSTYCYRIKLLTSSGWLSNEQCTVTPLPPLPDLVVDHVAVRPNHTAGTICVIAVLKNIGNAPAVGPFTTEVSIAVPSSPANVVGRHVVPSGVVIAPGATYTTPCTNHQLFYRDVDSRAVYTFDVLTDTLAQVRESNESNNSYRIQWWTVRPH